MSGITHHTSGTAATAPGATDDSLDPRAGGEYRDKPIWDLSTIAENLNRTGYDWNHNNYGEFSDGVLNFGFWKNLSELENSYYVNETGTISFNEAYYSENFSAFSDAQIAVAEKAISLWGDLTDIVFKETKSGDADIVYGNTYTGGAQAYAYLPFGNTDDEYYSQKYDFSQTGRLGGDVWIDNTVASNFFPLTDSFYATTTMIHETGHALGLSHPGDYNALDPNGNPVAVTYEDQAEYAQDSLQYSIMSYFDGYETGAQFIDFQLLNFAYPSTPMIHDIAAIQEIYGANMETRAGDTVYGFNTTETGTAYDFTVDTRPVLSIWDGGGKDMIDVSGYHTSSLVNLNAGEFSSVGGADHFYTFDEINKARAAQGFAPRTQATYDYYQDLIERLGITNPGFKDNLSIAYGVTIENATTGRGNDKIVVNEVANIVHAGGGSDTVSYEASKTGITLKLASGAVAKDMLADGSASGAAGDQLFSVENVIGSKFDDTIRGTGRANVLNGGAGDDTLTGGNGADSFVFRTDSPNGAGHDTIVDFAKNDFIVTSVALPTNGKGLIEVENGALVLNSANGDAVTFANGGPDELRFVGLIGGRYYYVSTENSTASQATLGKLSAPADTLDDSAAKTQAMIDAAKTPTDINLANRADGWTEASSTAHGNTNGTSGEHVDFSAANPEAFAGERGAHVIVEPVMHAPLHVDLVAF